MNTLTCRRWLPREVASGFAAARHRVIFLLALLALAPSFAASTLFAQGPASSVQPTSDDVEAAYLYNFGKFVTWPSSARTDTQAGKQSTALNICVLGQDPFGPVLDQLVTNGKINDRPLAVLRLSNTDQVSDCSILFISRSEASHLESDLSSLAQFPALTVSDIPGFVEQGGIIQFVLQQNRVRFEVNLAAAHKCGLVLSSQLLKLAIDVIGKSPEEAPR